MNYLHPLFRSNGPIEIINGFNQILGVVSGFDARLKGSKEETTFWVGQYYRNPDGTIDYDTFDLYDNLDTNWAASENTNNWNDITCYDMRIADSKYDTMTRRQQIQVDKVRGLATQAGCILLFCIDEPCWLCALISPEEQDEESDYLIAILDKDKDIVPVNDYDPARMSDFTPDVGINQPCSVLYC